MKEYFKLLKKYKYQITKQQYRTFKGQIIAGDIKGFIKGLQTVLYKKGRRNNYGTYTNG